MREKGWKVMVVAVTTLLLVMFASGALAQEKSVVEEILDILLVNHQITEEQYRYLLNRARDEERARARQARSVTNSQAHEQEETAKSTCLSTRKTTPKRVNTYWKDGLRFETVDKQSSISIGGKIHYDCGDINEDADVGRLVGEDSGSGSRVRRARLFVKGFLYNDIDFKAEYDFSDGDVEVKDLYLGTKNVPYIGSLRVGHTKEPFSLEELTSGSATTFMERSLPNALVPGRNIGFLAHNSLFDGKLSCSVGVFSQTDKRGNGFGENDRYNITGRVTALPWYSAEGSKVFLIGTSYSHKFMDNGTPVRFRARPESHLTGTRFVNTGFIPTDNIDVVDAETALMVNSLSLQSEYVHTFLNPERGSNLNFQGFYAYVSYFLTGERRTYCLDREAFGGVKPKNNFHIGGKGTGALEIGFRYSYLDLDDNDIRGGTLNEYTAGLNWYMNPSTRIMFNYIRSHLNNVGNTDIFESRFQLDF